MARILVALDESSGSEKALIAAVKLAQQEGDQLAAVAVLEQPRNPGLNPMIEEVKAQARRRLEELLHAAASFARSRGVCLTPILREGHAAEVILTCAEEQKASLLVLGASRQPNMDPGLGGTADQVSQHSRCTVLIAR